MKSIGNDTADGVKLILEPPTLFNPIEIVYDDKGKILGWRSSGWKKKEMALERL